MELTIPMLDDLALRITDQSTGGEGFPTRRLQKGLVLLLEGRDLAEEGVGLGVPILKRGIQTIFPGGMDLTWRRQGAVWEVTAVFDMSLVERIARPSGGSLKPRVLYAAKNSLAALHRRFPLLRRPLTATSIALRRTFAWVTTFEEAAFRAAVKVTYVIDSDEGRIDIAVDLTGLPAVGITEAVVMNEQGARHFDRYRDSDGTDLRGEAIGTWDEVTAAEAGFVSTADRVTFSLGQAQGARLSRGRELIGSRVAWSGFGYSLPPTLKEFGYTVRIERTT
ncbi:MAG TPA: hypothetical protein VIK38_05055 [Coriobacteriia bacterium]